ncbi:hypothetical protein HaLaN_07448 [Haematococcus lacustris]|uniref:Uncharacterized protein n=1 Tax=Haematococcus lacustris TaxID=44745 RepID=A0A699YP27_HAELA|nr:hypothetical protein HaLaN_07448 [Haematococcus lacustris]
MVSSVAGAALRCLTRQGLVAHVVAGGAGLLALRLLLQGLQSAKVACTDSRGVLWLLCVPVTHWLDVPHSLGQVLTSLLMLLAVNWGLHAAGKGAMATAW